MKKIKQYHIFINENLLNYNEPTESYYRGIGLDEAIKSAKSGHLVYVSRDPMSNDWEVIEYSLGDGANNISEDEVVDYVNDIVSWTPVSKGVNLTSDYDNAKGYSPIVVGVEINKKGQIAEFSDVHFFAENPEDCIVKSFYVEETISNSYNWTKYSPEEFLKNIHKYYGKKYKYY